MPRFSPSGFFRPSRCLIPTPVLTSEYPHLCSVCVCVRIHTHTPTYTPTRVKNREDTENTPIFPSVKKDPPTPSNKCPRRLVEPPHPRSPNAERTNCTCISAYAHPVASVLANVYADVHNTRLTYTPAHAWCPKHRSKCMHTLRKKCICARACAHMQRCRSFFAMKLLRTYLESCVCIVQAFVCRPPSCWLDKLSRLTLFAQEIRPNPR